MKSIFSCVLTAGIFMLGCSKSNDTATPDLVANICLGLVTDTSGTGDNARIYVPNAFTPDDNNGLNDIWRPIFFNVSSFTYKVYDATGHELFSSAQTSPTFIFPVPTTVTAVKYYYRIEAMTSANHHIGMCGEVYRLGCRPSNIPITDYQFEDQLTAAGFTGTTLENLSTCP